jgi:hypothetical protein
MMEYRRPRTPVLGRDRGETDEDDTVTEIPSEYRGWWRITETSQWADDGLDILGPALISMTGDADRLRMHCLLAYVSCKPTKKGVSFLAACGLLRSLTEWRELGWTRLSWKAAGGEGRFAVIDSERALDIDGVTQVLLCRSKQQRESAALSWSTKIDDRTKYRKTAGNAIQALAERGPREDVDMLAALASDLVGDGGALRSTAFDLTSGNQRILQSIRVLAGEPETAKGKPDPLTRDAVAEALIGPWKYRDAHHSLGWDPNAQRLHALRGKLPERDKENRSVRAAVFLASQALPLFPCFAVGRRLRTTGFHRDDDEDWFSWPVWSEPISLDALRSLLALRFSADLRERGVDVVYRCRRSHTGGSEGNYQVFSHPEERPWPAKPSTSTGPLDAVRAYRRPPRSGPP